MIYHYADQISEKRPLKLAADAMEYNPCPRNSSGGTINDNNIPAAVVATQVTPRTSSTPPEPFASRMKGREKRPLGDLFGLANFWKKLDGATLDHPSLSAPISKANRYL